MRVFGTDNKLVKVLSGTLLVLGIFYVVLVVLFRPSHDREWELGQEVLPHIVFAPEGRVVIEGFRDFDWREEGVTVPNYETRVFNVNDLDTVDVYISHFDDFEGLAHIFVSFGFTGGQHAVVSFETRREVGEEFSPLLGMLRQFEIIYVVGSEEDIVGVRTDVRGERVYLYPTKASGEQARALFFLLAEDINAVYDQPRIYNTLTRNCTNEITRRVEEISDLDFPFSWKTVLPGYFDEVLYDMNIIEHDVDFATVKARHLIDNSKVDRYQATYSADLRADLRDSG